MRRAPSILVEIDQASRDAFSQLLTIHYLRRKGAHVLIANQHTLVGMCERYRPAVVYASWLTGGPIMSYLIGYARKAKVVLIDQEGGRIGEQPFKRSFTRLKGIRAEVGKVCAKVFCWGSAQAGWLRELDFIPPDRIVVMGSPRFDPYLIPERRASAPYLGITLRGDVLTSFSGRLIEQIFEHATCDGQDTVSVGYPVQAQYEDRIWHVAATTRCLLKIALRFSQRSHARIILRPGPWEQQRQYYFLTRAIPTVFLEPSLLQQQYVRQTFALLDESSSMGLDGLVNGTPVVSVHALIPRLEQHLSGEGGGLLSAPYLKFYWQPKTFNEAVDLLLEAEKGQLAPMPMAATEQAQEYFLNCHGWPRSRPSSFEIGDQLLALLATDSLTQEAEREPARGCAKTLVYRHIPGSVQLLKMKVIAQQLLSADRQLWFRYHYNDWFYPHHQTVEATFEALWQRYKDASQKPTNEIVNQPCEILQ